MADALDVVVVGGGHNGLVAAAYLGRAGLRVSVLEQRAQLGGPCGTFEFMPGYRTAFTNSPGSLERVVVQELELPAHGLRFVRPDPTLVHPFERGTFLGWRDQARVAAQLDRFAPGEAARWQRLVAHLERLGARLGVSIFEPPPRLSELTARLTDPADERAFGQVFAGTLNDLLDEHLRSDEAKALMTMLAVNANLVPPSSPGSAIGLLLRPLSLASTPAVEPGDPRRAPLRGSTGLPVGSMGAIVDALEADCLAHGVAVRRETGVARILRDGDAVTGVLTADGEELRAGTVLSAVSPHRLCASLLDDGVEGDVVAALRAAKPRGSAFKLALALDRLPHVPGLPDGITAEQALSAQFRIGASPRAIEGAILDGMAGRTSAQPIMWGLVPSLTSPGLAPAGRHLLSVNVWHAPYDLADGDWAQETERFGLRCVAALDEQLPGLAAAIVGHRFMGPREIEAELGLDGANITHGDMLPGQLFGFRPHVLASDYRGPLRGLYLTGAGTWPGGYVTGVPGRNASRAILRDLRDGGAATTTTTEMQWSS